MNEEAAAVEERLKEIAPAARAEVRSRDEEKPEASVAVEAPAPARAPETREELGDGLLPIPAGVETPAVPLGPADEEFVTGRITQAEIFEKYGLMDQAVEQLREITKKFPGLSSAQERLADLLRGRGDRAGLRDTLVGLALAHRASGELEKAAQAAEQAALSARLDPETRTLLERLALLQSEPEAGEQKPVPAPSEVEAPAPKRAAAPPAPSRVEAPQPLRAVAPPAPRRVETPPASDEVEIVIDVEDAEAPVEAAAAAQSTVEAPAPSGVEVPAPSRVEVPLPEPPDEDLEEISFYLDQGMVQDARKLIASQRASGRGGERLGALEARAAGAQAPAASEELVVETVDDTVLEAVEGDSGRSDLTLDDAALESITAALRTDATSPEEVAPAPAAFDEQSVEDVFELFKRHVEEEIGRDDYRTHYDLGIAYKEMGILDDAVSEFRIAAGSTDIFRDACSMIALCYREKGEIQEAAGWYRQALDAPGGDDEAIRGLRFDLAEVLEQCGENEAALDLFRAIHRDDPSYREVGQRIEELESRTR
jgi:tetratricopeptide (TPR) repeat protein